MKRFSAILTVPALLFGLGSSRAALADEGATDVVHVAPLDVESTADGASLPLSILAEHRDQALVSTYGGYDSAKKTGQFDLNAELRLYGPLYVRGGAEYVSNGNTLKPLIGLEVQILKQEKAGVAVGFGSYYKPEGLTEPEGELESILSIGRRFDRLSLLLNLVYGQDFDGGNHDGEVRFAALYRLPHKLFVGVDTRFRFAIGTPEMGEPDWDFIAGPVVSYVFDGFAASAQVGFSTVSILSTQERGVVSIVGLSHIF